MGSTGGLDGVDEVQEEAKEEWVDDGSLPLVDNTLHFFLLDAHEEQATPGTVYLFGKVPLTAALHSNPYTHSSF